MQHASITAESREERGRKTDSLRAEGKVPAVMYGFEIQPTNLVVDRNAFVKVYQQAGESTVVNLEVAGVKHSVIINEIQRNPLTDFITHIDFRRVDPKRKIEANIPLKLVGESAAVKSLGGTLIQSLEEVEVMSLPDALVSHIDVDISLLKTFEDVIRVSAIQIPEGIELKTDLEQAVASVQPPRSEEEMAALDAAVDTDISKVEVLTEKKEDPADAAVDGEKKPADKKA